MHGIDLETLARELHQRADRPNLFIKIPGTAEGLWAIEQSTFAGVPVSVASASCYTVDPAPVDALVLGPHLVRRGDLFAGGRP